MVPIAFASSLLLLDVIAARWHPHEISRQMCRDHHQHSELFQDINRLHDEKYHPCPSMNYVIIENILAFPHVGVQK